MIDHVIVPVDGSELGDRALVPAADIARRFGAALVLLQAVHPDDVDTGRSDLSERAALLDAPDVDIVLDTMNGPVGALTEAVDARAGSLVCMSTHGRSGLGRAIFGSVAEETLREVGGPFLLVGPSADPAVTVVGPVAVPLDGSARSESILPLATSWARALDVGIWLVSVVDPADAERMRAAGTDVVEEAYVERIAGSLPQDLRSIDWEVLHSADPAAEITDFAARQGCTTIALATHGRTGLSRVVAGSVATRVVHAHPGLTLMTRTADPD